MSGVEGCSVSPFFMEINMTLAILFRLILHWHVRVGMPLDVNLSFPTLFDLERIYSWPPFFGMLLFFCTAISFSLKSSFYFSFELTIENSSISSSLYSSYGLSFAPYQVILYLYDYARNLDAWCIPSMSSCQVSRVIYDARHDDKRDTWISALVKP